MASTHERIGRMRDPTLTIGDLPIPARERVQAAESPSATSVFTLTSHLAGRLAGNRHPPQTTARSSAILITLFTAPCRREKNRSSEKHTRNHPIA